MRHRCGDFLDLQERQVASLVQLFPIEAVSAFLITNRSDKENYCVQAAWSFYPLN
jgi:hypothetical protein